MSFTIVLLLNGYKIIILKCIRYIAKENLLSLKRSIRTLKTKIYKYMTSVSKNVYIDKLDDMVNEYNNTYHRAIMMKPIGFKDNTYIDSMELSRSNDKDPQSKVSDYVTISKYTNFFAKGHIPNWSEEVFAIKKVKNTVLNVINDLNGDGIIETFCEKELQKTNQQECRIKNVIKRKGDKLSVKWKGYDSSCNSWIDKKDLIK